MQQLVSELTAIVGPGGVLTEKSDLDFYGKDSCKEYAANPSAIVLPTTREQVRDIVLACRKHKTALVPSGGRTGYSGGATAQNREIVLSLSKMNRIKGINLQNQTITVEAGVTTEAIQQAARAKSLYYPVDFASRGSSQIGGNVATNAGGVRVIRYGSTREWVLGLEVVTGSGEILELNGELYKNATGYDLRSLFIGSEGTLGIITAVTLKLTQIPPPSTLGLLAFDTTERATEILTKMRLEGFTVSLIEYFEANALRLVLSHIGARRPFQADYSSYLLLECETPRADEVERFTERLARLVEDDKIKDVIVAQSEAQRLELMALRERISETLAKVSLPHKNDISVSLDQVAPFILEFKSEFCTKFPGVTVVIFGHIGDGNLHINSLKPESLSLEQFKKLTSDIDKLTFELVRAHRGSISAEHGVGILKRDYLSYSRSAVEVEFMREIKRSFDPGLIMNPGKIFLAD